MADLSHWIYATDFTSREAAYLILGVDPAKDTETFSARHIQNRMQAAYAGAFEYLRFRCLVEPCLPTEIVEMEEIKLMPRQEQLRSVQMESLTQSLNLGDEVSINAWLAKGRNDFFEQRFSRNELHRWIDENAFASAFRFETSHKRLGGRYKDFRADPMPIELETSTAATQSATQATDSEPEIDPSDLPPELDAAMLAFRAVSNGFGDSKATFRNRLIEYLKSTYPAFKAEQVQRIATVANADPTPGRKKREAD